jgi:hypothetical protein
MAEDVRLLCATARNSPIQICFVQQAENKTGQQVRTTVN